MVEGARPAGPETHQCPLSGTSRAMATRVSVSLGGTEDDFAGYFRRGASPTSTAAYKVVGDEVRSRPAAITMAERRLHGRPSEA